MTNTLIALVLAHALADFVFQTNWMAANKRNPVALAAHISIVLATAIVATGTLHPVLFALAAAHLVLDAGKAWSSWRGLWPFVVDQVLHVATLVAVAWWVPELWASGLWAGDIVPVTDDGILGTGIWAEDGAAKALPVLPSGMVLLTGLILATRAGGFAIGLLMAPWAASSPQGLTGGGRTIGLLERGLIFTLVMTGMPEGIGFLIAAKSVLRFGSVGDDRAVSEYVIIGTLASFAWAIIVSFATVWALQHLTPLGIPDLSP